MIRLATFFMVFFLVLFSRFDTGIEQIDASYTSSEAEASSSWSLEAPSSSSSELPSSAEAPASSSPAAPSSSSPSAPDTDMRFAGLVCESAFFHDGRDEWITYYYTDVGAAQFDILKDGLEDYYDSGVDAANEIQLYSTSENIDLMNYVGKEITFSGEWFAAHTIYHRRDIVFGIEVIWDASGPP